MKPIVPRYLEFSFLIHNIYKIIIRILIMIFKIFGQMRLLFPKLLDLNTWFPLSTPQFHTNSLNSTHQFNTKTTALQYPKSLSLTPKTPKFNIKIPQFSTKNPLFQPQKPLCSTPKTLQFKTETPQLNTRTPSVPN